MTSSYDIFDFDAEPTVLGQVNEEVPLAKRALLIQSKFKNRSFKVEKRSTKRLPVTHPLTTKLETGNYTTNQAKSQSENGSLPAVSDNIPRSFQNRISIDNTFLSSILRPQPVPEAPDSSNTNKNEFTDNSDTEVDDIQLPVNSSRINHRLYIPNWSIFSKETILSDERRQLVSHAKGASRSIANDETTITQRESSASTIETLKLKSYLSYQNKFVDIVQTPIVDIPSESSFDNGITKACRMSAIDYERLDYFINEYNIDDGCPQSSSGYCKKQNTAEHEMFRSRNSKIYKMCNSPSGKSFDKQNSIGSVNDIMKNMNIQEDSNIFLGSSVIEIGDITKSPKMPSRTSSDAELDNNDTTLFHNASDEEVINNIENTKCPELNMNIVKPLNFIKGCNFASQKDIGLVDHILDDCTLNYSIESESETHHIYTVPTSTAPKDVVIATTASVKSKENLNKPKQQKKVSKKIAPRKRYLRSFKQQNKEKLDVEFISESIIDHPDRSYLNAMNIKYKTAKKSMHGQIEIITTTRKEIYDYDKLMSRNEFLGLYVDPSKKAKIPEHDPNRKDDLAFPYYH